MANEYSIVVKNMTKKFKVYYDKPNTKYNGFFASKYLVTNDAFDTSDVNIKCKKAGTYKVVFNSYSHLITIEEVK